jgi:hypothetical protein
MSAFSRLKEKASNGTAQPDTPDTKPAKIVADALRDAFAAPLNGKGLVAMEALAISLAGDDLKYPVGEALSNGAEALWNIATALERIADALEGEVGGGKKK